MRLKNLLLFGFPFTAAVAILAPSSPLLATATAAKPATACEQKVAMLNYRSELLEVYQKSENKKSDALHAKWSPIISYAGQWVPKDATKTSKSLYKYDLLHAATNKEIDKQIRSYRYLEKSPLDCSKTNVRLLTSKLDEVKGLKNKKVVGGNALIGKNKKAETEFLKKDFKKSSDKMIAKLHKEKSKHPKPQHPKTVVKT